MQFREDVVRLACRPVLSEETTWYQMMKSNEIACKGLVSPPTHSVQSLFRTDTKMYLSSLLLAADTVQSCSSCSRGGAFWPSVWLSDSGWSDEDGASHSPSARPETLLLCCHGNSSSHHHQHGPIMHTQTHTHTHWEQNEIFYVYIFLLKHLHTLK